MLNESSIEESAAGSPTNKQSNAENIAIVNNTKE